MKRFQLGLALVSLLLTPHLLRGATFFGPSPYTSTDDIPVGLYEGGSPTAVEDFEDGSLDFGISATGGGIAGPAGNTDSVDADDGVIDGSGLNARSWFIGDQGNTASLTFTFGGDLPTAAGIVWTDGLPQHQVSFEAFGPGMVSLGEIGPFGLADAFTAGSTAEDRFFGVRDLDGILAIRVTNDNAFGGLEVDHVQYGVAAVPEPASGWLVGLMAFAFCYVRLRH